MSDEILVRCENVSKKFCRGLKRSLLYGVQDIWSDLNPFHISKGSSNSNNPPELREDEFWAVNDISFELSRSECLGLIGHNGAGKSTLLKILNGLIKPAHGKITMKGRIGALIEHNAGFNPILTGRENVYVYGSILGFNKKEIDKKYNSIVDYAEMHDFMEMPFRSYSSGMKVRLGFAVAAQMEPDILLIDEVLAVGDVGFQIKCGNRIRELASNCAVIFVSHNMQYVSAFCSRVLLLNKGSIQVDSHFPHEAIQSYYKEVTTNIKRASGTSYVQLVSSNIIIDGKIINNDFPIIRRATSVDLKLKISIADKIEKTVFRISIIDSSQMGVINYPVLGDTGNEAAFDPGVHSFSIHLGRLDLNAGNYSFLATFVEASTDCIIHRVECFQPFHIENIYMRSTAKIIRPTIIEYN